MSVTAGEDFHLPEIKAYNVNPIKTTNNPIIIYLKTLPLI